MVDHYKQKQAIVHSIIQYDAQLEFSTALHPTNADEQKIGFLESRIQNPKFKYQPLTLPTINFPEFEVQDEIDVLYRDRMEHTKNQAALIKAIGDDDVFSEMSRIAFPLAKIPTTELQPDSPSKEPNLNTNKIVEAFQNALTAYEINDWKVEVRSNISSRMFVNQWAKLVGIKEGLELSDTELDGLIRHEIGVHVMRCVNGQKQVEPILHVGTKKGRLFEEGIACYMELPNGPSRIFLRHHAVMFTQSHSFRETFDTLMSLGLSSEEAWSTTLRVKRGLTDTAQHGGFTRDALYAQAFIEMQNYASNGGKVEPLLSAPIAPSEINLLKENAKMEVFPLPGILDS